MKNKILTLIMIGLLITGCGSNTEKEVDKPKEEAPVVDKNEVPAKKEFYFDGVTAEIEDLRIKITNTKIIAVGEKGNEHGEKPVFAIWYETTNKTDKELDPMISWLAIFEAVQDNNANFVNSLEVGFLPDDAHLDSQFYNIKKDGTLENSIAYELDDEVTPVTLIATKGMMGEELGRMDYKLD